MRFLLLIVWAAAVILITEGIAPIRYLEGAQATIPLERLAKDAELILRGTVTNITASGQARFITVNVDQLIKGDLPAAVNRVSVRAPAAPTSNSPVYQEGEEVILFLRRLQGMNAVMYETVGGDQGKYVISNGYVSTERMTVEEFIRRILRAP